MAETCPACGEPLPEADIPQPDDPITVNGETYVMDKLTFRERKQIKRVVGELVLLDNPTADVDEDFTEDDLRLAFAVVCARRANPDFSIDDGLDLAPDELRAPTGNVAGAPPTKQRAARKPAAAG